VVVDLLRLDLMLAVALFHQMQEVALLLRTMEALVEMLEEAQMLEVQMLEVQMLEVQTLEAEMLEVETLEEVTLEVAETMVHDEMHVSG